MKNQKRIYIALLITLSTIGLTCKKVTPDLSFFSGSARIQGTVLYDNAANNTLDTAKTATISIYKTSDTSVRYTLTLTNGTFDIADLTAGNYYIDGQYAGASGILYTVHQQLNNIGNGEFLTAYSVNLNATSATTPTMQLTVVDANNSAVPNAQVCLYSDTTTLAANRGTCDASVSSGTTNASGVVIFQGLASVRYYASAYITYGNQLVSNRLNDTHALPVPGTQKIPQTTIQLGVQGYQLQFLIEDQNKAVVANANVCLYSDTGLLLKNINQCTGSIQSGVTNGQGIVTFSALQNIPYYVEANKPAGTDTLSNYPTYKTSYAATTTTPKLNTVQIYDPTSLKVTITDQFNGLVTNANVCLYTNPALLAQFRGQCAGSVVSGTTNLSGYVTFTNLQPSPVIYYISAYKVVNTVTLSNQTVDVTTQFLLTPYMQNTATVVIQ